VTFTVAGRSADEVHAALAAQQINTSVSRVTQAQLDLPARGLPDLVRASPHYYNDDEDLAALVAAVAAVARGA
jgi:selenocysteine lyase/cysteine desulfurase